MAEQMTVEKEEKNHQDSDQKVWVASYVTVMKMLNSYLNIEDDLQKTESDYTLLSETTKESLKDLWLARNLPVDCEIPWKIYPALQMLDYIELAKTVPQVVSKVEQKRLNDALEILSLNHFTPKHQNIMQEWRKKHATHSLFAAGEAAKKKMDDYIMRLLL